MTNIRTPEGDLESICQYHLCMNKADMIFHWVEKTFSNQEKRGLAQIREAVICGSCWLSYEKAILSSGGTISTSCFVTLKRIR